MVIDSLKNSEVYEKINPLFKKAFDYIKATDFANAEVGKVELEGKDLFLMVSDTTMKAEADAKLEVHDKYIDIQVPVSKAETYGWKGRKDLQTEREAFNAEKDIQFFLDKPVTYATVHPGDFAIFWPGDGHAPCIGDGTVRKVVVKIKINEK